MSLGDRTRAPRPARWSRWAVAATLAAACASPGAAPRSAPAAEEGYLVLVASESADQLSRLRLDPGGLRVERQRQVGVMPTEIDGPHGLALAPDGAHFYLTLAHGTPNGSLWKVETGSDRVVGRVVLGSFPATVDVTPDGRFAFVANFNLHGDPVPSTVSKVDLGAMREVARIPTCVMPHGSRVDPRGTRHYSVCMMDQLLVEIDVASGRVARRFSVAPGAEGPAPPERGGAHAGHAAGARACSPTWAQPGADGARVYVACNRSAEVLEIDVEGWRLTRRFPTGEAPYNLAVTPDGRLLLATLKNRAAPATEVIDLASGRTVARVPASGVLPHGVAVTDDSRFALVSIEGVGAQPGRVDAIDLATLRRVGSTEVGPQAGGIAVRSAAGH